MQNIKKILRYAAVSFCNLINKTIRNTWYEYKIGLAKWSWILRDHPPHLLLLHTVGQLYYTLFNHCVGAPKWFQQFQPGRAIGCHKKWSCNEDHSEWLMWAKYKMCRAIKGGLLAELSILLRESFIKSSKRQGLCPGRTGRNTCSKRNGHSNNTLASRQEVWLW